METITLTFGDCGENHVGMQKIGQLADKGFRVEKLTTFNNFFQDAGIECELVDICAATEVKADEASILIIRNALDIFMHEVDSTVDDLFQEQKNLQWDQKAFMYGRVVNKHARHNLCYSDKGQEPNYKQKKGRIVPWNDIPLSKLVKCKLESIFGVPLIGEGNRYYDVTKCGIGYHGDAERRVVIGCRLGHDMPLHYNWYHQGMPVGKNCKLTLKHGDIYVMSEKAVGFDWKSRNKYTLRHAAGCNKFTKLPLAP